MPVRHLLFLLVAWSAASAAGVDMSVYPTTVDGRARHVIELPKVVDEGRFMVELVPGKTELADCNLRGYRASLERRTLAGWGYPFYVLAEPEPGPRTNKACPAGSQTRRFVRVTGDGLLLPYNSRLPLVVYLPRDVQLKYRIWRADKTLSEAGH